MGRFASADLCAMAHSCADVATRARCSPRCGRGSATKCAGHAVRRPADYRNVAFCEARQGSAVRERAQQPVAPRTDAVCDHIGAALSDCVCCSQRPDTAIHSLSIPQRRKTSRTEEWGLALADRVAEPPVDIEQCKVGGCPAGRPAIAVGDACLMAHQPGKQLLTSLLDPFGLSP